MLCRDLIWGAFGGSVFFPPSWVTFKQIRRWRLKSHRPLLEWSFGEYLLTECVFLSLSHSLAHKTHFSYRRKDTGCILWGNRSAHSVRQREQSHFPIWIKRTTKTYWSGYCLVTGDRFLLFFTAPISLPDSHHQAEVIMVGITRQGSQSGPNPQRVAILASCFQTQI